MASILGESQQPSKAEGGADNKYLLTDEEEAVASAYRKMLKIGIPLVGVKHKMKQAGVDSKIVSAVVGEEPASLLPTHDTGRSAVGRRPRSSTAALPPGDDRASESEGANVAAKVPPTDFEGWDASVDPRSPTLAWESSLKHRLPPLEIVDVANDDGDTPVHTGDRPCPEGHSRWVCVSDTHGAHGRMTRPVPNGDVLIHAGDFTRMGGMREMEDFCEWMRGLPHRHKIVIAGNHDVAMDESFRSRFGKKSNDGSARELIRSCDAFVYLEDSAVEVLGYKVYGSPWQPEFCDWAFNLPRGRECAGAWRKVPDDVDVLVTHGPPVGHGDLCGSGLRAGCVDLLADVLGRVKPSHHIFGHIHEGYGCTKMGNTLFVNASTCTFGYRPSNPPLVFDLPKR